MITLHHLRIGRSIFTVWALEELGVDYELKVYQRDPETSRAPEELKIIHPLGKSPVIEDTGLVVAESGAITAYLLEKFDTDNRLSPSPSNLPAWARFTQWLHYPEGSVFVSLLIKMLLLRSEQPHTLLENYSETEIKRQLDHITAQLAGNPYILGQDFSAVDFGISYVVSLANRLGLLDNYPDLGAYLKQNLARPAYLRAVQRAVE